MIRHVEPRRFSKPDINMKKNLVIAVPVSLIAVAALVLSFRSSVTEESLIGYVSVFALHSASHVLTPIILASR